MPSRRIISYSLVLNIREERCANFSAHLELCNETFVTNARTVAKVTRCNAGIRIDNVRWRMIKSEMNPGEYNYSQTNPLWLYSLNNHGIE